ncbi:MAG: hypothetical protein HY735_35080 [Verrucomicrobia bacterium]|nr:hypothetical protein [Verrucomicrobiota bacterium]
MNKDLDLVLRLEGLVLLRRGLACMGPYVERAALDFLEEQIDRLRRSVSGDLLSQYDRLARKYTNTIVPVSENTCQGCDRRIPPRLARLLESTTQTFQCPHCGRFLFAKHHAPAYVPLT